MRGLGLILVGFGVAAGGGGCGGGGDADGAPDGGPAGVCEPAPERTGEGTFYAADGSGNCSFDPTGDLAVAAMNAADYAGAAPCGACAEVTGPMGVVTVRVVDQCPECAPGDVDLSAEAFAAIAEPSAGRVPITWRYVPCDVAGPMRYRWKDGSSQWWAAILVLDHRHALASLEARGPGEPYRELPRADYNYFVAADGLGPGPIDLRLTDVHGAVVEERAIPLGDDTTEPGTGQFPACE